MGQIPRPRHAPRLGDDDGRKNHFQQVPQTGVRFGADGQRQGGQFRLRFRQEPVVHKLPGGLVHRRPRRRQWVGWLAHAGVQIGGAAPGGVPGHADGAHVQGGGAGHALPPRQRIQVNANHGTPRQPALQQGNAGTAHRIQRNLAGRGEGVDEIAGQPVGETRREWMQGVQRMRRPARRQKAQIPRQQLGQPPPAVSHGNRHPNHEIVPRRAGGAGCSPVTASINSGSHSETACQTFAWSMSPSSWASSLRKSTQTTQP